MTLLGKHNHYNVKLLKGYGVSISLKDNMVVLKNGLDILAGSRETETSHEQGMFYFYR
jgi:CRISPR-associated protein Cas1